jgi:hypothetical protein
VTVAYTVTSGAGTSTGNVTVTASGGTESCTGTVADAQCVINLTGAGSRTLTATYGGDPNFNGSASAGETHTVSQAATTTAITGHTPDPSTTTTAVTVTFTVTSTEGTPTGNVTVGDGVDSCQASVAVGTCNVTLTTSGPRTLTAAYDGDTNFATSTSAGVAHTVNP